MSLRLKLGIISSTIDLGFHRHTSIIISQPERDLSFQITLHNHLNSPLYQVLQPERPDFLGSSAIAIEVRRL